MEYEEVNDFYKLANKIDELELAEEEKDSLIYHGNFFATSDTSVYCSRGIVPQATPSTFRLIHEQFEDHFKFAYATDEKQIFYVCLDMKVKVLKSENPETFEFVGLEYSRDNKSVFHRGAKISYAKPADFEFLDRYYSKDSARAFYRTAPIKNVDLSSFELLQENIHLAKDKNFLYYHEHPIVSIKDANLKVVQTGPYGIKGVTVNEQFFTSEQLYELFQEKIHRKVTIASRPSNEEIDESLLYDVAEEISKLSMLCEAGSFVNLLKITRRLGEPSIVKALQKLNKSLPNQVAEITKETVQITPYGLQISRLGRPSSYVLFGKGREHFLRIVSLQAKISLLLSKLKNWASGFTRK